MIKYLQPHSLRKDCVLINNYQRLKKSNDVLHTEYLLCNGIIAVYEIKSLGEQN